MDELKYRYFILKGNLKNKKKTIGIRALEKPSKLEALEIYKDYFDEIIDIKETTEDAMAYMQFS